MGWAICFDNCKNCNVHCLEIISNVKNGDGIDFRSGCNSCFVDNITGYTSDDTVACSALSNGKTNRLLSKYLYSSEPYNSCHENIDKSIHDIKISNIFFGIIRKKKFLTQHTIANKITAIIFATPQVNLNANLTA